MVQFGRVPIPVAVVSVPMMPVPVVPVPVPVPMPVPVVPEPALKERVPAIILKEYQITLTGGDVTLKVSRATLKRSMLR